MNITTLGPKALEVLLDDALATLSDAEYESLIAILVEFEKDTSFFRTRMKLDDPEIDTNDDDHNFNIFMYKAIRTIKDNPEIYEGVF